MLNIAPNRDVTLEKSSDRGLWQEHIDGYRGRESLGRLAVHGALLAPEGCRPAVPEDGPRGALPTARRGRLRTAGSRRDASTIRSRRRCDRSLRGDPTGTPALNSFAATRSVLDGRLDMGLWKRGRRYWTQTVVNGVSDSAAALPTWINSRDDELAGGRSARKGIDPRCVAGQPAAHSHSIKSVRSRRRLSQGEESHRQHATSDRLRPRTAGGRQAPAWRRALSAISRE